MQAKSKPRPACSVDGCETAARTRGFCATHYSRWQKHGDPQGDLPIKGRLPRGTCSVDGCLYPVAGLGLCGAHWRRLRKHGDPQPDVPVIGREPRGPCSIAGCSRQTTARGWCPYHYGRWLRHGDPLGGRELIVGRPPCSVAGCRKPSVAQRLCDTHYRRWLTSGDPLVTNARKGRWRVGTDGYVYWSGGERRPSQHRYVMERMLGRPLRKGETVHHCNGVRHDNRPENLELWSSAHPSGQRISDLVAFARDILDLYGKEADRLWIDD